MLWCIKCITSTWLNEKLFCTPPQKKITQKQRNVSFLLKFLVLYLLKLYRNWSLLELMKFWPSLSFIARPCLHEQGLTEWILIGCKQRDMELIQCKLSFWQNKDFIETQSPCRKCIRLSNIYFTIQLHIHACMYVSILINKHV